MANQFTRGKYRDEDRVIAPALEAIEAAWDILVALPDRDSTTFFRMDDHLSALANREDESVVWHLFWDAYNWLKFYWYSTAYKARQLTAGLIHAYNTDNLLTWLILGRSSLEYAAISYYFVKKMNNLRLQGPDFEASQLRAFEELMLQYAHGTRFNWPALMTGDLDGLRKDLSAAGSSRAVNVLTALSHLARRDDRFKDVEAAYYMLSDFAHPNMASHAAVLEMPSAPRDKHECQLAAAPGALRGEFVAVISLPWISMGIGTMVELLLEVAPLMKCWLGHVDEGARITIDFAK